MRKLRFSTQAIDDLRAIVRYIAEATGSRSFASGFAKRLKLRCADLARHPQIMGSHRPELLEGLRSASEGNYLIFFHYVGETFEVVRIVESHRDLAALFRTETEPTQD